MKLMAPIPVDEIIFDRYRVSKDELLGEPGMGMKIALASLNMVRVTVGAAVIGMACAAYEEALRYSQRRMAFNKPLIEFETIQFKLADMVTNIEAARSLVLETARKRDSGMYQTEIVKYVSMAKLFATEVAQKVVDEALQIHGGWGLVRHTRIEQLYKAVRAPRIYEGTSEIQRLTIARMIKKEVKDV
jgi:alkylation response protein AidB-like acyl-CoA dehydrogenase